MTRNQDRQPAGVPTGGQFAASIRAEAGVALAEQVDPVARYQEGVEATVEEHALLIEGIEYLPAETRATRRRAVAEHFEHVALAAANDLSPSEIPNPGRPLLSEGFGRLSAAADLAVRERLLADHARSPLGANDGLGDALVEKVLDTRDFTAAHGVPFRARIVRRGAAYGRDGTLTATEDMVMFFDARYPDHPPMIGHAVEDREATERNGQFVASYYVETLREHQRSCGLALNAGVPDWTIDGQALDEVMNWMDRRAPLRDNPYAGCTDMADMRGAHQITEATSAPRGLATAAAQRRARAQARETRHREILRGWNSVVS